MQKVRTFFRLSGVCNHSYIIDDIYADLTKEEEKTTVCFRKAVKQLNLQLLLVPMQLYSK